MAYPSGLATVPVPGRIKKRLSLPNEPSAEGAEIPHHPVFFDPARHRRTWQEIGGLVPAFVPVQSKKPALIFASP